MSQGLYRKFVVRRTDGTDGPGMKHDQCSYFVLDLTHDKHSLAAIRAYAKSCKKEHPVLSDDLMSIVHGNNLMKQRCNL